MAAFPAVDQPVEQSLAGPGNAARLVLVVFAVVVLDHGLDFLKSGPSNIGRILVRNADLPLGHRQAA